jgi:uncharacterized protein YodC (DUF2158 family)
MSDQITAGSVVELKSGGPDMTVSEVEEWNGKMRARCQWFDGKKNQFDYFPVTSLKLVAQESSGPAVRVGKPGTWS